MIAADLHVHSIRSDGSSARDEILQAAKQAGLTHIAFTEHDTTRYVDEGVLLGRFYGIHVIPALEISAYDEVTAKKAHILGYHFQTRDHIDALCKNTLRQRHENCLRQIRILQGLGYFIDIEEVLALAGGGCLYKQHILSYLYKTKQSECLFGRVYQEIFKNGGPCDFDISYASAEDAVRAVVADGGYAVLAHPGQQQNFAVIPRLAALGLRGIERNHPGHREADRREICRLSGMYHLFCTGGSDFHGEYEARNGKVGDTLSPDNPLVSKVWHIVDYVGRQAK